MAIFKSEGVTVSYNTKYANVSSFFSTFRGWGMQNNRSVGHHPKEWYKFTVYKRSVAG